MKIEPSVDIVGDVCSSRRARRCPRTGSACDPAKSSRGSSSAATASPFECCSITARSEVPLADASRSSSRTQAAAAAASAAAAPGGRGTSP